MFYLQMLADGALKPRRCKASALLTDSIERHAPDEIGVVMTAIRDKELLMCKFQSMEAVYVYAPYRPLLCNGGTSRLCVLVRRYAVDMHRR